MEKGSEESLAGCGIWRIKEKLKKKGNLFLPESGAA